MAGVRWNALLLAGLAGCGVAPDPPVRFVLEDPQLAVEVRDSGADSELLIYRKQADDSSLAVVRARGVVLALGGVQPRTERLRFASREQTADGVLLRCRSPDQHEVTLLLSIDRGDIRVEVRDQVGLASDIRELSLGYELVGAGAPDELFLPHLQPQPGQVVGHEVFRAPAAFLRHRQLAIAILPELEHLAREQHLPEALELDADGALRHGLIAHAAQRSGDGRAAFFTRDPERAVQARGGTISFAHRLRLFTDAAPQTALSSVFSDLWQRHVAADLARSAAPLIDRGFENRLADGLARLAAAWQDIPLTRRQLGAWLAVAPRTDAKAVPFSLERQSLRTAHALLLRARRTGDTALRDRVAKLVALCLAAPRHSGLCPSVLVLQPGNEPTWIANDLGALAPQHYRALDAADACCWLLELTEILTEHRQRVVEASGALARFLAGNQQPSGAIPALYDTRFLAPHKQLLHDNPTETAGLALFLARHAAAAADAGALAAAERALLFVAAQAARGCWPDLETAAAGADVPDADPRSGLCVQGSLGPALAVLAVEALPAPRRSERQPLAVLALQQLARHQQIWSPPWRQGDARGGLGASNIDDRWNAPQQATAARAFLAGYRLTGAREWLQRGAMALRASVVGAETAADAAGLHAVWGSALQASEQALRDAGHGLVDVAGGFAEGLDALWFERLSISPTRGISLRLLTHTEFDQPIPVRFANLPPGDSIALTVNDVPLGAFSTNELRAGVRLRPAHVPWLRFVAPTEIRADRPWQPRAQFVGPAPADFKARVEVRRGEEIVDRLPMQLNARRDRMLSERPLGLGLPAGTALDLRLVAEHGRRRLTVPQDGWLRITLGEMNSIDAGSDDDDDLLDAGDSVVRPFAGGRGVCRATQGEAPIVYRIPVPVEATSLRLVMHLDGPARIEAGPREGAVVLRNDEEPQPQPREVELTLSDRRLWRAGELALSFRPSLPDATLALARIRYRAEGVSELTENVGERRTGPARDQPLRIAVVPLSLADAPLNAETQALQQLFFGGPEYTMTPEPHSRRTAGSVRELLAAVSGGRTAAQGTVLAPQRSAVGSEALTGDLTALAAEVRRLAGDSSADVIVAVHAGKERAARRAREQDKVPVVFLGQRGNDDTFLAVGDALAAILEARFNQVPLRGPEHGSFGALALNGGGDRHLPAGPAGINLMRAGWADAVRVDLRDHAKLRLAPLQAGRTLLRLPGRQLPGRPDLLVEVRRGGPGEPGLGDGGALLYWQWPTAAQRPFVRSRHGAARPTFLRLSPSRGVLDTPFVPGDAFADLVSRALELDGSSRPGLATPQGEVLWTIHDLRQVEGGDAELSLRYHVRDVLPAGVGPDQGWSTGSVGAALAPLATDGQDRGVGQVQRRSDGLWLSPAAAPRSVLRGRIPGLTGREPARLFARVGLCVGEVELRLGIADRELLRASLADGEREVALITDLPAGTGSQAWIEVVRTGAAGACGVLVDRLDVAPRARHTRVGDGPAETGVRLMDGTWYGNVLRLEPTAGDAPALRAPVVLRPGDSMLRVIAGLAAGDAPGTSARVTLRLRDAGGATTWTALADHAIERTAGSLPLFVGLLEVPAGEDEPRVGLLDVYVQGAPLHVVSLEIARP
jgi:hypothetical protein